MNQNVAPRYAVNIADLTGNEAATLLFRPFLERQVVRVETNFDGMGAPVRADAQIADFVALVNTLRGLVGGTKHELRIYERRGGRWERVDRLEPPAAGERNHDG